MTDRILVPGWAEVISYYIGAEVFSVFFGMPVHAVTWRNTTRLFAAAVTEAGADGFGATLYRFADDDRTIEMRLWQLTRGASYVLEAGPADGLGLPPKTIEQTVPFTMDELGRVVAFTLPGRTTYAVRIRQTALAPAGSDDPRPDVAIAPRDIRYDLESQTLEVTVHNVGAAPCTGVTVTAWEGTDTSGPRIGHVTLLKVDAPLDQVRWSGC